jgi:hypothetical protein
MLTRARRCLTQGSLCALDDLHQHGLQPSPVIEIVDLNRLANSGIAIRFIDSVHPQVEYIDFLCLSTLDLNDPPAIKMDLDGEDLPLYLVGTYLFVALGDGAGRKDAIDAHEHEENYHEDQHRLFKGLPLHDRTSFASCRNSVSWSLQKVYGLVNGLVRALRHI